MPWELAPNDEGLCPESFSLMMRAYALRVYTLNVEGLCPDWYHMHAEVVVVAFVKCCVVVDALSSSLNCQ